MPDEQEPRWSAGALGRIPDDEAENAAKILNVLEADVARLTAEAVPYCDVCGRDGDALTSDVEVCRHCYDGAKSDVLSRKDEVDALIAQLAEVTRERDEARELLDVHIELVAERDAARAETERLRGLLRRVVDGPLGDPAEIRAALDAGRGE